MERVLQSYTGNNRVEWIDVSKFVAISLVVLLHIGIPGVLDSCIHLFHMPIFFFISGLCFDEKKHTFAKEFILSRAKTLIIPYFLFSFLFYIFWRIVYVVVLQDHRVSIVVFLKNLLWTNTTAITYLWGAVQWFLACLFFVEVIFFFLRKIKSNIVILLLVAVVGCVGFWLGNIANVFRLPLALDVACIALIFYAVGNLTKQIVKSKIEQIHFGRGVLFCLVSGAIVIAVFVVDGGANMRLMQFGNPLLYLIGAFSGIFMLIVFSKIITMVIRSGRIIYKFIILLGQNTIIILFMHRLFDGCVKTILELTNIVFPSIILEYCFNLVEWIVCLIVMFPIIIFINKHWRFLIGKF